MASAPDLPARYAALHRRVRAVLRRESVRRTLIPRWFYEQIGVKGAALYRICADPLRRGGSAKHLATWEKAVVRLEQMAATLPRRRARREVDEMAHFKMEG